MTNHSPLVGWVNESSRMLNLSQLNSYSHVEFGQHVLKAVSCRCVICCSMSIVHLCIGALFVCFDVIINN